MNELILLGQAFILSWVITHFKPLQMLLDMLPDRYIILNLIILLLSCLMCVSFWTSLILSGNIWIACLSSFMGFWYDKIFGFHENRVRLN